MLNYILIISLKGQVEGLLGNFNGNASDDLMSTDTNFNKQVASGMTITPLQQYQMMQFRCKLCIRYSVYY